VGDDDVMDTPATIQLSGDAAVAILMTLLGEPEAAAILSALSPDEARRVGTAMMDVAQASPADIETALDMFVMRSRATSSLGIDPGARLRSVFTSALGDVRGETLLNEIAPQQSRRALEMLQWMPSDAIAVMLESEHPQVGALVLACLSADMAAAALAPLDEERQSDLIYRAASIGNLGSEALDELANLFERYSAVPAAGVKVGGRSEAAKIVTRLPKGNDRRVLKRLKKRDKDLAQAIEDDMFVFEDLFVLDAKSLGALLRTIDATLLSLALRGAAAPVVEKMLGCLSTRTAQTIRDEMAEGAPVKREDVEAAQKEIAGIARQMGEAGDINIGGGNDDYV